MNYEKVNNCAEKCIPETKNSKSSHKINQSNDKRKLRSGGKQKTVYSYYSKGKMHKPNDL